MNGTIPCIVLPRTGGSTFDDALLRGGILALTTMCIRSDWHSSANGSKPQCSKPV
jgi:hypothetical protein